MATRAIKPKRDDTMLTGFQSMPERAPSVMREDRPSAIRVLALGGLLCTLIGFLALIAPGRFNYLVNPTWGGFFFSIGVGLLMYHAFGEKDTQFRRLYASLGLTLVLISVSLRVLPFGGKMGGYFLTLGIPGLLFGLLLFLAVLRSETDLFWRAFLLRLIGILGAAMVAASAVGGQVSSVFLVGDGTFIGEGILLMLLGLMYVGAFIAFQENEEVGFLAGCGLGVVGLVTVVAALARSYGGEGFLVPDGFALMGLGLLYCGVSLCIISDWPFVVMLRRELASYFYSPIAYLVLFGLMLIGWVNFWFYVGVLAEYARFGGMFEPIVRAYIVSLIPVVGLIFMVPVLTMRLLSEEKRTGTLEVLLTAPVNETTIVLSKFFAALIFYLLNWLPSFVFLLALRFMGGEEFDYRPVLSFALSLTVTGAGFIAMGLFFSSVTRNQIVAAVFTFVGMMVHLGFFMLKDFMEGQAQLLNYVSFLDLWRSSLEGQLAPRILVFHASLAVFFLFLTVKVLDTRKWK